MASIVKISQAMTASCPELSAASRPEGLAATGLSGLVVSPFAGARLRGLGMTGLGLSACAVREVSERPTKAPAAVVAKAHAYAAANGAGHRTDWIVGAESFKDSDVVVTKTQQNNKKRAFRGLEPWRDPA